MSRIKHILVGVDQLAPSEGVLARAAEIGRAHDARITIISVTDPFGTQGPVTAAMHLVEEHALRLGRARVEEAIGVQDLSGLTVDIQVETGSAHSRIVETSKRLDVDLIVLGAHQRRSVLERIVGSTADRVIRAASASVLVVKRAVDRDYQKVMVAVDFADNSESAALLTTKYYPGANLELVNVIHISTQFEQALQQAGSNSAQIEAFRRNLADYSVDRLAKLASQFVGKAPEVRTRVLEGEPARTLVHLTRDPSIDLICVGPYKHGLIHLALLGSVTQRLLREAACDVLICRPPTDVRAANGL